MSNIFNKAAKIAFSVAGRLGVLKSAVFKSITDNGIDDPTSTSLTVDVIREDFTQEDIRGLIFRDKIQPTDAKLLVLGSLISSIDMNDTFTIDGIEYTVFGYQLDAANAVWTVGVR